MMTSSVTGPQVTAQVQVIGHNVIYFTGPIQATSDY